MPTEQKEVETPISNYIMANLKSAMEDHRCLSKDGALAIALAELKIMERKLAEREEQLRKYGWHREECSLIKAIIP